MPQHPPNSISPNDVSNGYDAVTGEYIKARSDIGSDIVRRWAKSLPNGGHVIDIGAGYGEPITSVLIHAGLTVSAIDASPNMVAAFKAHFPDIEIACEAAEQSRFFGRHYDGALAIGLVFLMPPESQTILLQNIARALKPKGQFLFSAPHQTCTWEDVLTKRQSYSLGVEGYRQILENSGLTLIGQHTDAGGNHYYDAQKG